MEAETNVALESGLAALLFAAVFLFGNRLHPFKSLIRDRRSIVSFGAGMSAAYVFVHVLPELHGVREAFVASASIPLRYEGMAIYFFALIGFLVFYGLEHLRTRLGAAGIAVQDAKAFRLHVGGFAAYVWLMGYLLLHNLEETGTSVAVYAVAIAFHFVGVDHELRHAHGEAYRQVGRFVLAGAALLGWALGLLVGFPPIVIASLFAFVAGAVIMNSALMELPSEKDGKFPAFLSGGLVYGLILLPLA